MYYESIIKTEKIADNGKTKTVTERYLVEACSFTECEAKVNTFLEVVEFELKNINPKKYEQVIEGDNEMFFIATIIFLETDDNGKEKEFKRQIVINSDNIENAKQIADKDVEQFIYLARLGDIKESKIIDVIQ